MAAIDFTQWNGTLARLPAPLRRTASIIGRAREPCGTPLVVSLNSSSFWSRLVSSCSGLLISKPRSDKAVFKHLGAYVLSVLVWCCPLMAAGLIAGRQHDQLLR